MCAVRQELRSLAPFPWPVRVEGARGTGKNLAARLLHDASGRTGGFVRCGLHLVSAAEGRELAELFGWARGAFTGAVHAEPGVFERAHRGTAFLNELGIASPRVQEILLQLLEERTVQRIGEHVPRPVDVRVVFATNVHLEAAVRAGTFRADLYDRLGLHVVRMPTLSARMEDLPELVATILTRKAAEAGVEPPQMPPADLDRLMTYDWPGNVRELENALEHYVVFRRLPSPIPRAQRGVHVWHAAVTRSLEQSGGNISAAARALGISRKTLHAHLKQRLA
jgi:two-component system response regulator HydG